MIVFPFLLVTRPQIFNLGRGLRHRLGVFGLILLRLPLRDLHTKGLELAQAFPAAVVTKGFLIAGAQIHQLLLHGGNVQPVKLLFLQSGQFLLESGLPLSGVLRRLTLVFALGLRLVPLTIHIEDALFQVPDLLALILQVSLGRKELLIL